MDDTSTVPSLPSSSPLTLYRPLENIDAGTSASSGEILLLNNRYEESLPFLYHDLDRADFTRWKTLTNIGIAERYCGHYQTSNNAFARALMDKPDSPATWLNLANLLVDMGEFDAALMSAANAYKLDPANATIRYAYGCSLLREGRWAEGWRHYDSGRYCSPRSYGLEIPEWHLGLPTEGRKVLIIPDGGFGDTFLFLRYSKMLKDLGAHVTLICPLSQLSLLNDHPFVDAFLTDDGTNVDQHSFDYFIPQMSLPAAFVDKPSTVPYPGAHLFRDFPISHSNGARRVGICWKAGEAATSHKFRSFVPTQLDVLRDISNIEWQSLVPGIELEWASSLTASDWLATAEVISSLDLVIAVDTAVAHLAAMMGKPTWILLHAGSDWKWLRDSTASPWWNSARLFRADAPNDFLALPDRVARELR